MGPEARPVRAAGAAGAARGGAEGHRPGGAVALPAPTPAYVVAGAGTPRSIGSPIIEPYSVHEPS